nr:uncharacterized protein LOC109428116 [Aedes albopictus]
MNSVRGQPKVSSAEHAVEIDSFSTTQHRLSECPRYFPKRDHQLPSSDNIIPTKKARFSSGHPEAPGGDSVKLHSHQSTDLPGRDNTIKQPEMELKVAEGDMGFEIPTFVNNAPAIEVRCNRDTAHQEICAKTKKIYEKRIGVLKERCQNLQGVVKEQAKKLAKPNLALEALENTFNPDQVDILLYKRKQAKEWSDNTITESLKTKFVCGKQGYEHVRQKYPLPTQRTLQKRMEDLNFDTGILDDVIELLKLKLNTMTPEDLDCGIVFDEMSIEEARSYSVADSKFFGDVTISGPAGTASHALVFMLVGVRSRWKQVVGYHFTGHTIFEEALKDIVFEIIEKVEAIGCKVCFITSDCGPSNKKLWNCLGLKFHKEEVLSSQPITHPFDDTRTIEVIPDVIHVFKSTVQGWIKNEVLFLPADVVESCGFVSNEVRISHLRDLVHFEHQNLLKVSYGLTTRDVEFGKKRSNFDAMKVINSHKYVNSNIAAALKVYINLENRPDVLPTAYFIEQLSTWFRLSKNRSFDSALNKGLELCFIFSLKNFLTFLSF